MCEENKLELEKNDCQLKCFAVKQWTLEGCRRAVTRPFRLKLATKVVHNIKGISNITVNYHCVYYILEFWLYITRVLAVVTEPSPKISGWLVLQNSWADIFHRWDVDSTQLEL